MEKKNLKSSNKSFGILFFIVFFIYGLWPILNSNEIRLWSLLIGIILGAIAGSFFGKLYHRVVDAVLSKIPGLNSIYNTVKQIIDTFATTQSNAFKEVVLIEYPQKDIYALAFFKHYLMY